MVVLMVSHCVVLILRAKHGRASLRLTVRPGLCCGVTVGFQIAVKEY